ncbi:PASTA domain-containing protein [Nocardioides sp.]|uniref:PASTA domain-containing protein n=1 Tax=Nocardioides sp. TaxID=35761 RepID=UPI003D098DCF
MLSVSLLVVLMTACGQGEREGSDPSCEAVDAALSTEAATVPPIDYGTSVDDAMETLARAGLCGERPDVDFPYYVTGTDPSAGSTVERGTHITFLIGDG